LRLTHKGDAASLSSRIRPLRDHGRRENKLANYYGTNGADNSFGTSDNDLAYGYAGDDYLRGAAGDDELHGGAGNDILRGGAGIDRMYGGDGFDRISFSEVTTQGVIVDLRRQLIINDGFGNQEKISSIEALGISTRFMDIFRGNDEVNQLLGNQGDRIFGYGGDDQLLVDGIANTKIDGGDGRDSLTLPGYQDVYADDGAYLDSVAATEGIVVDLSRGLILNDGFGQSGRITSIEDFYAYGDTDARLTGSDGANLLSAGSGADRLMGRSGDDELHGEGGDDRLFGDAGGDVLVGGAGKDLLTGGDSADVFAFSGFNLVGFDYTNGGPALVFQPADSGATQKDADRILDFNRADGDLIDLSGIDAQTQFVGDSSPDDAFVWRGTAGFTGAGGEARYQIRGGNTFIYLDIGGEDGGDMVIRVDGEHILTAGDFVL
jgi:Ca2+-binding RTX toxin-like protein